MQAPTESVSPTSLSHPVALLSQDPLNQERTQIVNLLSDPKKRRGRLPYELDQAFRHYVEQRALQVMRSNTWITTLFYVLFGFITYENVLLLSSEVTRSYDMHVWMTIYLLGAFAFGCIGFCVHQVKLEKYYSHYMAAVSFLGLTGVIVAASAFLNPYINQHATYIVIFIYMLVYNLSSLRLVINIVVGVLAAFSALVITQLTHLPVDMGQYLQYAGLTNLIGAAIAYMGEQRDRNGFLQARLVEIEKHLLDKLSQEMARLSQEDGLTTLANRRHFNELLSREWALAEREQKPISLIFVDVDHFKAYNDTYGHLEGDRALQAVGKALKRVVKRPTDLAARYGGEEFVLLLPNTDEEGAMAVAGEVREAIDVLNIPHKASKAAKHLSVSIGLSSIVPSIGQNLNTLIDQADEGVYAAKKAGRHRIRAWHLLPQNRKNSDKSAADVQ